jgi:hypothetical protein
MPGLNEYQATLADVVRARPIPPAKKAMLGPLSEQGLAMTGRVRTSWCIGRARRAARLTLSALPESECDRILEEWIARDGGTSSFFEADAEAFLVHIAGRLEEPSHAASLCRMEMALIRARAARHRIEPMPPLNCMSLVQRSPHAELVRFHAPIGSLLAAIEGKRSWPHVGAVSHSLLIAPGIAGQARDATVVEIALWDAAENPVPAAVHWPTARSLVACGVLQIVPGVEI